MKTRLIDQLLRYNFNRKQRRYLAKQWYMNGCGGKWGFSFSNTIRAAIKELKGFNQAFYLALLNDIEKLCWEHDIDFTLGNTKKDFRLANFRFAWRMFKLLRWGNFFGRLSLWIIIYVLLNRHGKHYFNFKDKKTLEDLFINYTDDEKM